eukprot:jgi/Astpho2/2602/Aster-x0109
MLANPATQHCSPDMPKTASSKVQLPARRGEGSAKPSWQHSLRGGPAVQQLAYKGSAGARSKSCLTLSTVLSQNPQLFDDKKIGVVEKFITEVDLLPQRYHHVRVLYLSKNSLRTLHGLQQFACLRVLSAGDNLLDSFEELVWLKPPRGACQLEALSLEGNPLSRLPNYRAHVVAAVPSLRQLDGKAVTSEERHQAAMALRHEETVMALMLSNACLVHKLVGAEQGLLYAQAVEC